MQHSASGEPVAARPNNNGPFAFTPDELMDLIDPKAPELLGQYGGVEGVLRGLHADPVKGLSTAGGSKSLDKVVTDAGEKVDTPAALTTPYQLGNVDTAAVSMEDRQQYFGRNVLSKRKPKNIFQLMWIALQEKILVCFRCCCSLCFRAWTKQLKKKIMQICVMHCFEWRKYNKLHFPKNSLDHFASSFGQGGQGVGVTAAAPCFPFF